ncbi:MAG: AAA family ATPase [Bacteroidales bacterium]|nr:AAA family ATPase [Bacteroidales bacterium]MCF8391967.1 AAA family ATPase [Bacteroidales bacterium]
MYLKRTIDEELINWKLAKNRKPLMLRGARQVGKTSTVKKLAEHFIYFVEINFDEQPVFSAIFEKNLSVFEVCEQLSVLTNTPIVAGKTLLFLDEIQTCIPAISMLRYFYEKMPELHVIAAGSLLEFALADIPSFGVGRVRSLYMYPLSFREFLMAHEESLLLEQLIKASVSKPLSEPIHQKLINLYKKFLIIGGMPEAVSVYVNSKDLLEVQRVLNDIVISVQADFAKYKTSVPGARLVEVFNAIARQVATKFTYSYPNATLSNLQIKEAIELLKMAGLVYAVTHSAANGIPLGAEINPKKTKYLLFDTGIFQRILGLNIADILINTDFNAINKGNIAELYIGLELLKAESCYQKTDLFYWQREAKNSQAEVDYVCQFNNVIVPVEVKAGTKGSMQSLYLFLKEKKLVHGFRLSLENFSKMEQISILPVYAVNNLADNLLKEK